MLCSSTGVHTHTHTHNNCYAHIVANTPKLIDMLIHCCVYTQKNNCYTHIVANTHATTYTKEELIYSYTVVYTHTQE